MQTKLFYFLFIFFCFFTHSSFAESLQCQQKPGLADAYVLGLSWQPGFCETYGYEMGKPECLHLQNKAYHASHLALHGLWPNQKECGQHYGFCGVQVKSNHCAYPALNFQNKDLEQALKHFMPSYAHGSCLERHEWNKHGSCQLLPLDDFFSLSVELTKSIEESALAEFLHSHVGKTVSRKAIREAIAESFGEQNINKVYLGCSKGVLVDLYVQLPLSLDTSLPLASLVDKAPDFVNPEGCPRRIKISNFATA